MSKGGAMVILKWAPALSYMVFIWFTRLLPKASRCIGTRVTSMAFNSCAARCTCLNTPATVYCLALSLGFYGG